MKILNENNGIQFNNNDVEFIKKHFRYPINSSNKIVPILFGIFILSSIMAFAYLLINKQDFKIVRLFPFIFTILFLPLALYRYINSLFFIKIENKNPALINVEILKLFFKENSFVIYQMPTNIEVFMLQGNPKNNDEHEIVIFIACKNYFLINSYIQSQKLLPNSKRKYKELVLLLKNYLQNKSIPFSTNKINILKIN